jgi:hypothetical protein
VAEHVLAVNGSPRAERGITHLVLQRFLAGCRAAGATTEVLHLARLKITPCEGELGCFFSQKHVCEVHPDDEGDAAVRRFATADRIVLASPLHVYGISSHLQRFMERLIVMGKPNLAINDGVWTHPGFGGDRPHRPSAVIGVCAFPGVHNFVLFREIMQTLQKVYWLGPSGNVLVPMSRDLSVLHPRNPRFAELQRVLAACERAGAEFMERGAVSPETEEEVSRPTAPIEDLVQAFEGYFAELQRRRGA